MEIQIGEYVRTDKGKIGKITKLEEINTTYYNEMNGIRKKYLVGILDEYENFTINKGGNSEIKVAKHSFNIIDLIEAGDYVNGKEVYSKGTSIGFIPIINYKDGTFDIDKNIKSIVTKEQFKSVEYKIKEKK